MANRHSDLGRGWGASDPTGLSIGGYPDRMTGRTLHGGIDFDLPWQSEIVPGVWQGGVENGMALTARFVHVVSLYRWGGYRPHPAVRSSLTVTMLDSGDLADLDGASIHRTAEWVNACRRDLGPDEAVLVHCQAGLNRSGVVTALALMLNGDVATADEAIALLRARRGEAVLCNPLFVTWLRSQEAVIRGERAA